MNEDGREQTDASPSSTGGDQRALILAAMQQARRAGSRRGSTSSTGPMADAAAPVGLDSVPEDAIPGYRLLREIHRGGQGVVYQAVQNATQRVVAVKVMREGPFAGAAERARFEREVQLLAELDHPSVVTIHDSGSAAGSFFFVMDYVRGLPLDAHVEKERPGLRDTLTLFAKICEAVEAAHLRGIIHRDLKPGNIRVDEKGEPRVLDFGLAKRTADSADDRASHTITGQFVGSLPWASPEQALGETAKIDVRSDVYSLGVVLYQMLAGRFPYSVTGAAQEVLRRITEEEPGPPSGVTSERARELCINDEADTIALKCLAKPRERRYQSAGEVARDVRRLLAGEPIDAKRDSVSYVLRKQLKRHRVPVAIVAGFIVLLVAGMVASLALWRSAERHRAEAEFQLGETVKAEKLAAERAQAARDEAARAEKVLALIGAVFRGADPKLGGNPRMTAAEVLERGSEQTLGRLQGTGRSERMTRAALLNSLGDIFANIGEYARGRSMLEEALAIRREFMPSDDPVIAMTERSLADLSMEIGDTAAAARHYRAAMDAMRARLAPSDWHLIETWAQSLRTGGDAAEAEGILRDFIATVESRASDGPRGRAGHASGAMYLIVAINSLCGMLDEQGRTAEAVPLMEKALAASEQLVDTNTSMRPAVQNNLAFVLLSTGDLARARTLAEDALRWRQENLQDGHLDIASSRFVLGRILLKQGLAAEAESLLRESLRAREAVLPADDGRTAEARAAVSECLRALGR